MLAAALAPERSCQIGEPHLPALVRQSYQHADHHKFLVNIDSRTSFDFDFKYGFLLAKGSRRLLFNLSLGLSCANRRFVYVSQTTSDTGLVHQIVFSAISLRRPHLILLDSSCYAFSLSEVAAGHDSLDSSACTRRGEVVLFERPELFRAISKRMDP
jgi:hypothetical protein